MNAPPNQNCPEADVLQELAAGIGSPELAQQTMQHVARCATCSAALRRYISEFSEEQSPENAALFNQLQSSKPQWQKQLVRDQIGGGKRFPWLKLVPAMAALAVAIFAVIQGPALLADFKVNQAQKQIATAFAGRRTTEMRLPSVSHSDYRPFPIELGGENGRSLDEVPTSLHDASGAANQNLLAAKADPRWLQVQGLALLWESTPSSLEKAEKDFEKARSAGLATPSLEIDLAASYFERDSRAEHPNLQRTLNLLSEVLSKPALTNDDRASALFNLALAYEKTQAWDLAVSTWEKYLQVDSSSAWTAEAQQHLKDAKAKISSRPQQSYSDPSFFLQQKAQGTLRPEDPEQYQQKALTQWLSSAIADKNSDAYRALSGLAEVFAEHQDFWWRDFLKETKRGDLDAVRELSSAVLSNEHGVFDDALVQSRVAASAFRRSRNNSGEVRAQLEEVYALRNKLQGANCLARAGPTEEAASGKLYRWVQAQLLLEKAQCQNFQVELAESDHDSSLSLQIASEFSLPVLKLRNFGISAGMKHQQGKCDESWTLGVAGLGSYWQGKYPPERLDQFYAVMWQCARETGYLYLAEAILRHTIDMREDSKTLMSRNQIREGMLHLRLASILFALKNTDLAGAENRKASSLLKSPSQAYIKDYILRSKIEPAEIQLQHGDASLALSTLLPVEQILRSTQDKFIAVSYYRVLGNIYWNLRQLDQASAAYQSTIGLVESSLNTLKDGPERLAWLRAADDSYRGLVRVLLEQKKAEQALERWEWYQGRPLLQGLYTNRHAGNEILAGAQKKSSALMTPRSIGTRLIYASFNDGLQTWVRNGKGVKSVWLDLKQQDFERMVREFMEHCANPDSNLAEVQEQGQSLYIRLLQPVIPYLSNTEIVTVELDRSAYNLPMEALRSPDGWYFGEKYSILYSPGEHAEEILRQHGSITPQTPMLILDASHIPKSGYLPGMEEQRTAISSLFPRATVLDSANTSWNDVKHRFAKALIFHYMGHGRADGSGTALVFSQNRSLSAKDFAPELFRNTQLVVLAACSTAKGRDNGLWDTDSLVHAFLGAGVPLVVASHWNVDSQTTSKFMISFYRHAELGETIDAAAFHARGEILAHIAHPYYWAGFSVTGSTN